MVSHFDDREAGVLLMVGAEATIVRTSPADGRVERARHLRRLYEHLAALAVVAHVIRDQDALVSMSWAVLQEVARRRPERRSCLRSFDNTWSRWRRRRHRKDTDERDQPRRTSAISRGRRGM